MRTLLKLICPGTEIAHCVYLLFKSILERTHTRDDFTLLKNVT
jgi:hypothetical protein